MLACSSEGVARLVHDALLHLLNACLQYCALRQLAGATAAALHKAGASADAAAATASATAAAGLAEGGGASASASGTAAAPLVSRAELQRRAADVASRLALLRREFGSRQRLFVRVLQTKAGEAGSHADELRRLLGAVDGNRWFEGILNTA